MCPLRTQSENYNCQAKGEWHSAIEGNMVSFSALNPKSMIKKPEEDSGDGLCIEGKLSMQF